MENLELFERFGLAIAIGAIVGVERHWRERDEEEGKRTAGLRTFTLAGMLGGLAGFIEQAVSAPSTPRGLVVTGILIAFSAVFALYQYRESEASGSYSVTSVIAGMATFSLGALAVLGSLTLAAAGGVALVVILASREVLHGFMKTLTWNELRSAIIFLAMAFIVLPALPTTPIGPFGGVSPAETWMLVILLAGISFIGYVAVKALGQTRGELLAGAVSGLVSSTATAINNAQLSAAGHPPQVLVAGALAANAVSCLKVALFSALIAAPIAWRIGPALVAAALVMGGISLLIARRNTTESISHNSRNPFELPAVLKMALLLVAVAFLARASAALFGDAGLLTVSMLSGIADVDAITVTVAGMLDSIGTELAATALGVAAISNTVAKSGYAVALGASAYSIRFLLVNAGALAVGFFVYQALPALLQAVVLSR
ncbi:MgtC/SapB family protein [Rhizobium sp. WYCCWR 11279]|uniref:MgtC/SapB family protein n=1 Tax=Rhizobium changzhiense TaxID=2692317 RepID=UPI001491917D|nr:MgtC/SapB family protein [Rhizobium changzhiense]NNU49806.1 MgtC/SapB family protein [Rhizobium changzhiense]